MPPPVLSSWELSDGVVRRGEAWRLDRQARAALDSNDLVEAERLYRGAIEADPSHELAVGGLGVVHMRNKAYQQCADASRRCLSSVVASSTVGACYFNLGKCLEHLGELAPAHEAYRYSLESRENDIVDRALISLGRRLRLEGQPPIERRDGVARANDGVSSFLGRGCKGRARVERTGALSCGSKRAWGISGGFSAAGMVEVLLVVHDASIPHSEGSGYGVLLRRRKSSGRWEEAARTPLLAPGEGGVDFLGVVPLSDGRLSPVVQSTDCWQGCCAGAVRALAFALSPSRGGVQASEEELFAVGSRAKTSSAPSQQALVTAAREIDEDGDGRPGLLLRFESRVGRADPTVRYLRVEGAEGRVELRGTIPSPAASPPCR